MRLHRLLYIGQKSVRGVYPHQEIDILRSADKHNQSLGCSGVLWSSDGQFVGLLEGPKESLELLSSVVFTDPRHRVNWSAYKAIEIRQVSLGLPLGLLHSSETSRWFLDKIGASRTENVDLQNVERLLLAATAMKYPSMMLQDRVLPDQSGDGLVPASVYSARKRASAAVA